MTNVTVPGTGGRTVTLTYDSASNANVAAQIGAALEAAIKAGKEVAVGNGFGFLPPLHGKTGLLVQSTDGITFLPHGYSDVVDTAQNALIFGSGDSNEHVLAGTGYLDFVATGGSGIVDTGGGNNLIAIPFLDNGNWLILTGNGQNTIADFGHGSDTISTGTGRNTIVLGDGHYDVTSVGRDTIVAGSGAATINASGSARSASELVYGGRGPLVFVGGAGAATIIGGFGSETVTGGSGSLDARGGRAGHNVLTAGSGIATLFGAGNGDLLTANGSMNQALFAGAGSETLTGAAATGADTFAGGSGRDQITGSRGADTFIGGSGHATVNAIGSHNLFEFVHGESGGTMQVNDLTSAAQVDIDLVGYGPNEVAHALHGQASNGTSVTLTLSDNTRITFANITHLTSSNFS